MPWWVLKRSSFLFSVPEEFLYDPVSKSYGDPSRRPECKVSKTNLEVTKSWLLSQSTSGLIFKSVLNEIHSPCVGVESLEEKRCLQLNWIINCPPLPIALLARQLIWLASKFPWLLSIASQNQVAIAWKFSLPWITPAKIRFCKWFSSLTCSISTVV